MDQPSLAYLLVDIAEENVGSTPAQARRNGSAPLNLSLVLDTSGSMAGAKLQNLKKAVAWVIDHLSDQDSIAITLFSDEVQPLVSTTTAQDRKTLQDKVQAIRESGGTTMSKGLEVGLDEVKNGPQSPGTVSRIVLLTDGQTWGDADQCKELAAQAGAAGIPITALGVGAEEDWSIELLDAIAAESGGNVDYIAKPEEISPAFERALRNMQSTATRNLRFTINPSTGVSVRAVYRVAPILAKLWPAEGPEDAAQPNSMSLTLPLGDMPRQGGQSVLFEVMLAPRKPGQYRLAQLLLQYEASGPSAGSDQVTLDLTVAFAAGAGKGPGNPRVMNSVEKATTFKLQTRALQASMAGDVGAATRNLRAAATRLLNMGETELADAAEQEAQKLESEGKMSAAGTKKLTFETRKLAVSEMENSKAVTVRFDEQQE
jgi:Ca-activated chloride channel family protein